MTRRIEIIDLGINNLTSVIKAFSANNEKVEVRDSPEEVSNPKLIVLPGLGKFASGMAALNERKLVPYLKNQNNSGVPIVGICLGMQLLGESSQESANVKGLGLISAKSLKLKSEIGERIPHVSWARTELLKSKDLFPSLGSNKDFYFVHSYHVTPDNADIVLAQTNFGSSKFNSAVFQNNVLGFQFHPEKSGKIGNQLISEIISWASNET